MAHELGPGRKLAHHRGSFIEGAGGGDGHRPAVQVVALEGAGSSGFAPDNPDYARSRLFVAALALDALLVRAPVPGPRTPRPQGPRRARPQAPRG